jgi:hypothetical protein
VNGTNYEPYKEHIQVLILIIVESILLLAAF